MEHLKYLSWLNYLFALLSLAVSGLVLVAGLLMAFALFTAPEVDGMSAGVTVGAVGFGLLISLLITALYVMAGRGVARGRGRMLQTVLGVLALGSVPMGTIYGIYGLWVCWVNEDTKKVFDEPYALID